jgi:hypothetical protein
MIEGEDRYARLAARVLRDIRTDRTAGHLEGPPLREDVRRDEVVAAMALAIAAKARRRRIVTGVGGDARRCRFRARGSATDGERRHLGWHQAGRGIGAGGRAQSPGTELPARACGPPRSPCQSLAFSPWATACDRVKTAAPVLGFANGTRHHAFLVGEPARRRSRFHATLFSFPRAACKRTWRNWGRASVSS